MVIFSTYLPFSPVLLIHKNPNGLHSIRELKTKNKTHFTLAAHVLQMALNYRLIKLFFSFFFFLISSALSSCVIKLAPWNNISGQLAEHPELVSVENLKMISRVKDGRHSKSLFSCVVENFFPQWTVGGGMTHNLFPATAAEMCCLSSICMCVCMLVCDPFKMSH